MISAWFLIWTIRKAKWFWCKSSLWKLHPELKFQSGRLVSAGPRRHMGDVGLCESLRPSGLCWPLLSPTCTMPKLIHGPYDRPYSPFGAKDVHVLQVLTWGETGHRWVTMTHGRHISSNSWMGSTFEVRRAGRSKRFLRQHPMVLRSMWHLWQTTRIMLDSVHAQIYDMHTCCV